MLISMISHYNAIIKVIISKEEKMQRISFSILTFFLLLGISVWAAPPSSIDIISVTPQQVKDGDDYYTDVWNDPVDFDKRRDIMWEGTYDETSITVTNNTWFGVYNAVTDVWPLYKTAPSAIPIGNVGQHYPLDPTKYNLVSFQYKLNQRIFNGKALNQQTSNQLRWPNGSGGYDVRSSVDGYRTDNNFTMNENGIFVNYIHDLSSNTSWTDSAIDEIRFRPRAANMPVNVTYRWFRIVDPTTSPTLTIDWNATVAEGDMPPSGTPQVMIYFDTDNKDFDGTLLFMAQQGIKSRNQPYTAGSYSFPSAVLAPGTYYFYIKLYNNYDTDTELAASGYSTAVTINGKSRIHFENPSRTSGPDYATEVLGNPWDMNASDDFESRLSVTSESWANGTYTATTTNTDPRLHLNIPIDKPIDTERYHYFTYTMDINTTGWETYNINDKLGAGWVSRIVWGHSTTVHAFDGYTNDLIDYETPNIVTLDLRSDCLDPDQNLTTPWEAEKWAYNFRFDPLEANGATFYLHDIKLTGDPEPDTDGNFTVRFTLDDPENDTATVLFYIDTDTTGYDGTLVGSGTFNSGKNTKTFNTTSWKKGLNYLYAVVTDNAGNVSRRYADAPIVVTSVQASSVLVPIYNYLLQ